LALGIHVVVVEILDQDQKVTLEEDLMDMVVDVDLVMAAMGMEVDLEEIMEVEITMILEIITSNLLTMVQ
jgi:hypothetical protein